LTLQVSEESIESSNSFVRHKKDLEEASKNQFKDSYYELHLQNQSL